VLKLKAIIEWADTGVAVRMIEGFDLPPKTGVEMSFPLPLSPKPTGMVEETFVLISAYKCKDCGFETESFDLMMEHQRSKTLWQRVRRFIKEVKGELCLRR